MGDIGKEEEAYNPPPEFKEDVKKPLLEITSSDSTEFWLIQWPKNRNPELDGQEVTLKLHQDGNLGSFKDSSGREYQVSSFASQEPNATVFVSSASGTQIAGKVSRRVSLVHYSEPEELQRLASNNLKKMYEQSSTMSLANSSYKSRTPQSSRMRNSRSMSGRSGSKHISKNNSSLSEAGEPFETPKRKNKPEPSVSTDHSPHSSGRGNSGVTSSESMERSHQGKSQKKKKEKKSA